MRAAYVTLGNLLTEMVRPVKVVAQRAMAEPKPSVSVQGLMNFRDNGIGGRPDGALRVTLLVTVWNRNQGAISEARFNAAAAQRALEQLELGLQERLAPVYERYTTARSQVEQYRSVILPTAEKALDLVRQSYQAGEVGFINLLTVQRTFAQTNLASLDALRELKTAEAEIDGLLLSGSLQTQPSKCRWTFELRSTDERSADRIRSSKLPIEVAGPMQIEVARGVVKVIAVLLERARVVVEVARVVPTRVVEATMTMAAVGRGRALKHQGHTTDNDRQHQTAKNVFHERIP